MFWAGPHQSLFLLFAEHMRRAGMLSRRRSEGRLVTLNQRKADFKTKVMSVAFSTFSILRANYKAYILTSFGGKGLRDFFLMGIV